MKSQNQNIDRTIQKFASQLGLGRSASVDDGILALLKEDHKPLKEFIKQMKDSSLSIAERKQAFSEFAPLLISHAVPEEKSLYEYMKGVKDLREDGFEGDAEHGLADQMCEEIKRASSDDEIGAKIKVLAELVEHHIKEEENDMFPEIEKHASEATLKSLAQRYVAVQTELIAEGQDNAPPEKELNS